MSDAVVVKPFSDVHRVGNKVIATLLHESEYVKDRLLTATSPDEVLEVVRTGEQAVLD